MRAVAQELSRPGPGHALADIVCGRHAPEGRLPIPGPVEIGTGASSADIRQVATLPLRPAPLVRRPARVAAADFDDYANVALVDTTREAGTAVTPADPARPGWLTFTNLHTERGGLAAFRVACPGPRGGRIEIWLAAPDDEKLDGTLDRLHAGGVTSPRRPASPWHRPVSASAAAATDTAGPGCSRSTTRPTRGLDLMTGGEIAGALGLPPGGSAVIRERTADPGE